MRYQLITEDNEVKINHGVFDSDEDVMAYLEKQYEDPAFDQDGEATVIIRKIN